MGAGMSRGRRRGLGLEASRGMLPLLALQVLMEYGRAGASRPPMTAALLAANVLIYLRPGALHEILPSIARVSFNPQLIIEYHDWTRFFLSPFYHLSESHLFYNMTSLLWKGIQLETSMGSAEFASMVAALLGLSQGISLLLAKGLILFGDDTAYYDQYAVGFSGVLFAMKVVLNAWSDNFVYLHGMVIPAKYAAWAELILIQVFIPGTSFLGHLGGILAGLVYLWLKRTFNGPDPLTLLISSITKVVTWPLKFTQKLLRSVRSQGRITGGGRVGRRASARETGRGLWRCSTCTYDNSIATDICEMCSTAREDLSFSRRQNHQAGGSGGLSVDEFMLWDNLILSNFYHWNEVHLFSNMTSLLWMGRMLETHMGSAEFTSMIVILLGLSESIAALLSRCLVFLGDDMAYFDHYSVGFSGVLFGMEAVLGTCADSLFAQIPGLVIPAKCAVWAELFLTQALIPKSSFIGHLGGLLAGYIYIWLKNMFKGRDPCTLLISGGARVVTSQVRFAQKLLSSMPQGHKTGGHRVGCHSPARECPPGLWRCSTCTSYNSLATDVCEMCSTMREDHNGEVSVEEMRRRRLDRFDR